jgi:hypothetical protein
MHPMTRPSLLPSLAVVLLCGAASAACAEMPDEVVLASPVGPSGQADLAAASVGRLCGRVFDLPRETRRLPDFEMFRPFEVLCTDRLAVSLRSGFPGFPGVRGRYEWFGADFQGIVTVTTPGVFSFRLSSDDGSKLIIDDNVVLDNDGYHDVRTVEGTVTLAAGQHRIRVPFWQGPGPLALTLEVGRPGEAYQIFRADRPLAGLGEPAAPPAAQ